MKKSEAYVLNGVLGKASSKSLGKKDVIEYIKLKLLLKKECELIEEFRENLVDSLREGDDSEEGIVKFKETFSAYLSEDSQSAIDSRIFTVDKMADFIKGNDFSPEEESHLISKMVKE